MKHLIYEMLNDGRCQMIKSWGPRTYTYSGWRGWSFVNRSHCRVQLKRDGTRRHTGGEVKGKLANGVGSQYPSLPRNMVYPALLLLMRTPGLQVVDWTDAPADLNGLVRLGERQSLVSARVPSHFKHSRRQDILRRPSFEIAPFFEGCRVNFYITSSHSCNYAYSFDRCVYSPCANCICKSRR
jgi:hypothetical protein